MNYSAFSLSAWVKASFFGWFAGIILIVVLSSFLDSIGIEGMQFYIGIGMGAGVGFFQWRNLKRSIPIGSSWFWLSVIGLGVPFLLTDLFSKYVRPLDNYFIPFSIAFGSIVISILQLRLLRKFSPGANWWLLWSFAGWVFGTLTSMSIDYTKYISDKNMVLFGLNVFLILAGGMVLGFITGKGMASILNEKQKLSV